jgi:hypothetical protein
MEDPGSAGVMMLTGVCLTATLAASLLVRWIVQRVREANNIPSLS